MREKTHQELALSYQNLDISKDDNLMRKFNIVSAGLHNYLPQIDSTRHEKIFREILLHQRLSTMEQTSFNSLNFVVPQSINQEAIQFLKENPSIICTFHLGSYRLINLLLIKNNIAFSLVIANKVLESQGETFQSIFDRLGPAGNHHLINAESPGAALQMLRALKQGKSLVVYLDGNTGSGQQAALNENCCTINFFQQELAVRTGVGYLSHAAKVPVLPVLCHRKGLEEIVFRFFDPIISDLEMERQEYSKELMQQLYDKAGPYISMYPGQWEAWLYLYKSAVIKNSKWSNISLPLAPEYDELTFNDTRFGLFKINQNGYIFDKSNYLSYKIDDHIYMLLINSLNMALKKESIDVILLQALFEKGVLMAA